MDSSMVGGLSAVLGSLVGGTATVATAWFTQRAQGRRETAQAEIRKREMLYAEFIAEASRLAIDALDHTLDSPSTLVQLYGLLNRIRLMASDAVVEAAQKSIEAIVEQYDQPKRSFAEVRTQTDVHADPLRAFSEACRRELRNLSPTG